MLNFVEIIPKNVFFENLENTFWHSQKNTDLKLKKDTFVSIVLLMVKPREKHKITGIKIKQTH